MCLQSGAGRTQEAAGDALQDARFRGTLRLLYPATVSKTRVVAGVNVASRRLGRETLSLVVSPTFGSGRTRLASPPLSLWPADRVWLPLLSVFRIEGNLEEAAMIAS